MNIFYAILLGFLQGATEFLPISSSGHLVLAEYLLGLEDVGLAFDVALHLGTLMAVLVYFRKDFLLMGRSLLFVLIKLLSAFVPTSRVNQLALLAKTRFNHHHCQHNWLPKNTRFLYCNLR